MNYPSKIISMGEQDSSVVKQIQCQLNRLGAGPIVADGKFGKITKFAVKAYQSSHCNSLGLPLDIDGKVGFQTWTSLFGTKKGIVPFETSTVQSKTDITQSNTAITHSYSSSLLLTEVIKIAQNEVGVREVPPGSNKGPRVEQYLGRVHLGPGYAWCAAFVYWCFDQASLKLTRLNPLVQTPACMEHWKRTQGQRIKLADALNNPRLIVPGEIFIINHGGGKGHTGIVVSFCDGYIQTIEGNTNTGHSSEGIGVFELRRQIKTINAGFIKYS